VEFSERIKQLRQQQGLSQEAFAQKLHVTRQAVSNWENNHNLPDLAMLIEIAQTCHVSLDSLILGDQQMTKIEKKLIKETDENRKAKFNLLTAAVGAVLMLIGFICFAIKAHSVEYVDKHGFLHENFFLIPIGYLFLFVGLVVILVGIIAYFVHKKRYNR
jgi:transcriptional regulator with XRE-family HTH domain